MAYVTVDVDVDLNDFDDDEIREEYKARGLGEGLSESEEAAALMKIRQLILMDKHSEAVTLMSDFIRNKLGVAI